MTTTATEPHVTTNSGDTITLTTEVRAATYGTGENLTIRCDLFPSRTRTYRIRPPKRNAIKHTATKSEQTLTALDRFVTNLGYEVDHHHPNPYVANKIKLGRTVWTIHITTPDQLPDAPMFSGGEFGSC